MPQTTDRPGLVPGHAGTCRCSTCSVLRLNPPPPAWSAATQPNRAWTWRHWTGLGAGLAAIGFTLGVVSTRTGGGGIIIALCILAIVGGAYFLPTIIASSRKHHNIGTIAVVNVFLGWTFIGWVVALAMAASAVRTDIR